MAGKIVNKHELCAITGKTAKTLTIWQAEGMPFVKSEANGAANDYNTAEVFEWYARRQSGRVDPNTEKAALLKEQAEAARRKNAVERGDVIQLAAVKSVLERFLAGARQRIMNSKMSRIEKQATLAELRAMKGADFSAIQPDEDATEPEAD